MPLLEVRRVSKRFGGHQALSDVSLEVRTGEVHALAGENGAGKSTLMAVLTGALVPDTGTLLWEGREAPMGDVRAARTLGISIVHQEPQLVPSLSVAENVCLGRLPVRGGPVRLVDRPALRRAAAEALEDVRAAAVPVDALVGALGVAQRQVVAIARALHFGARLIILDEPTSSLSMAEVEALFLRLRGLRTRGTALVYISHRLEELRAIADRVTILRDGRVVATAPLASMSNDALIEAMSGRALAAVAIRAPRGDEAAAPEAVLEVRGLRVRARSNPLDVHVCRGEVVGLAGLVGAGRSRLLRSVFGAEPRAAGTVTVAVDGARQTVTTLASATAAGIGFVPEDRRTMGLVLTASVGTNIGLRTPPGGERMRFLRGAVVRAFAERAVAALGIRTRGIDAPVRVLSGGNQQKVVLARWLRSDTRVLLLDEPTRGVDVGAKAEIHRHLRALADGGLALLVASSEVPELLAVCDRIYVMREGSIVGEVSREAATPAEIIRLATGTTSAGAA